MSIIVRDATQYKQRIGYCSFRLSLFTRRHVGFTTKRRRPAKPTRGLAKTRRQAALASGLIAIGPQNPGTHSLGCLPESPCPRPLTIRAGQSVTTVTATTDLFEATLRHAEQCGARNWAGGTCGAHQCDFVQFLGKNARFRLIQRTFAP